MTSDTSQLKWLYRGLVGVGAFVLLYALSFGPANSFGVRGKIPAAALLAVYRPIPGANAGFPARSLESRRPEGRARIERRKIMPKVLAPNNAAPPNRRPCFAFAALRGFGYSFCARPGSSAAAGEPQRSAD